MQFIILLLHVLVCVSLIALVLVQHGKGADIGAAFGAGASNTVFGSSGSGSFLMKLTGALAAIFFLTSLFLGHLDTKMTQPGQFQLPIGKPSSVVIPNDVTSPTPASSPTTTKTSSAGIANLGSSQPQK